MSVFGALDASADTQWIRVTPLRHTVLASPDPLGSTVTLERAGTGKTVTASTRTPLPGYEPSRSRTSASCSAACTSFPIASNGRG